jgi:hypothetical protein
MIQWPERLRGIVNLQYAFLTRPVNGTTVFE